MKLTQRNVAGLQLPDGKTDKIYFDDDLKGFGLRLRSDGGGLRRIWVAQYRAKGHTRRLRIGDAETVNADQARAKAKVELAKVTLGQDPQTEKEAERAKTSRTLIAIANEYLEMKALEMERGKYRASSYRVTKLYLSGPYFQPLHKMPITDITVADIARCLNSINKNSGSPTAGRARAAMSALFGWSMQQGFMGPNPHNPVVTTKNPDETPATRDRVLSDVELAAIWNACGDDDFGKIVKLLLLTACRRDEIGGVRWSEIDAKAGTLTLPKSRVKNKHEHTLPLTAIALEIIGTIPERVDRDHLFGDHSPVGFTKWTEEKARLDARLGDAVGEWRLHDLRRSAATGMVNLDVEPHHVEAVLNHYSGHRSGVAGVYNRSKYERQIRAALALWADHLRSLIAGGGRKIVPFPQAAQETA